MSAETISLDVGIYAELVQRAVERLGLMGPVGEADIAFDAEDQRVDLPVVASLNAADETVGGQAAAGRDGDAWSENLRLLVEIKMYYIGTALETGFAIADMAADKEALPGRQERRRQVFEIGRRCLERHRPARHRKCGGCR